MQPPTLRHRLANWLSSEGSIVLFLWQTLAKKRASAVANSVQFIKIN